MTSEGNAKLSDFGFCSKLRVDEEIEQIAGGEYHCAPEMLTGSYNHSVDFWSLGISIFFMLTSDFPFKEIEGNESFTWEHSTIYSKLPDLNEK